MRAGRSQGPFAALAIAAAALTGAASACIDTGGPGGTNAIGFLRFPSPSVVIGDVLRDSLGAPAPLAAEVFSGAGDPIEVVDASFVSLDSTVRIDPDGTVHGLLIDSIGARIVASANGIQTPVARLPVTVRPDAVTGGGTVVALIFPITTGTSPIADSLTQSAALQVTVRGASGRGSQGIIVDYEIVSAPAGPSPDHPTSFLANDAGRPSARDTTDMRGGASRKVTFLHRRATGELAAGLATDTITVRARVRYLGADVAGSPLLFKVPVRRQ